MIYFYYFFINILNIMKYNFYVAIILILFSLVKNVSYDPVLLPFEVNNEEVKNVRVLVPLIWIYTKIDKDSQIIMDITCHTENRIIKKEDVRYGKYFKETNSTEFSQVSLFVANGNKYTITYDVAKDKNDYGVVEIKNLAFNQQLTIQVKVISKTTYWLLIVLLIVVAVIILIGAIILCRCFCRCCKK